MNKKTNRDVVVLSVLTFLTALTWIAYDVYRSLTKYMLPNVLEEQMKRLEPRIDRGKIEKLKQRWNIPEEELDTIGTTKIEETKSTENLTNGSESTLSSGAEE